VVIPDLPFLFNFHCTKKLVRVGQIGEAAFSMIYWPHQGPMKLLSFLLLALPLCAGPEDVFTAVRNNDLAAVAEIRRYSTRRGSGASRRSGCSSKRGRT
jgi:hypothetical protein